jgi:hypothetical protein
MGNAECVEALLKYFADVNAINKVVLIELLLDGPGYGFATPSRSVTLMINASIIARD